jgi:hypothetical protein
MKGFSLFERDDLIWSGKSIFEPSGPLFPRSINLEMMGQDAGATIYGQCRQKHERGGRRFSSVSFRFEPEDRVVIESFHTLVGGQSNDMNYNIAQFLDMIARTIVVDGRFVYELQIGRDNKTQKIVEINFSPVSAPGSKILVFGRRVIQLLPSSIAKEHTCSPIRTLNPDHTFIFQAPSNWRHALGKARSALHFFDAIQYRLMDQLAQSMKSHKQRLYTYDDLSNPKLLATGTASLGWSGRSIFQGYQNDYLMLERLIRWNRFCIDLRNHMILTLKLAVDRIASILNSDCRLIVEEQSDCTLEDVRKKLQEGKTSTAELVRLLF